MLTSIDIETLPSADPEIRAMLADKINPPGNYIKAETIAKWQDEVKPGLIEEAMAKTGLDGAYGSICVIGLAFDDAAAFTLCADVFSERDVLKQFMATLDEACKSDRTQRPLFCGHNIHGFDLPFIWKRCVINRVKPSLCLPFGLKAWSERIADTMLMWDDSRERRISLPNLCKVLGMPRPKTHMDSGADVAAFWAAGKFEEVAADCRGDVEAARACYRRMRFEGAP